jgi:toxin ParE1/3/4
VRRRLEFTPRARRDVERYGNIRSNDSASTRRKRICATFSAPAIVTENPRRGVACDEIRSGYRKLLAGSHILFFRVSANRVVVVRILHARMDFGSTPPLTPNDARRAAAPCPHSLEVGAAPAACAWAMALATVAIVGAPPSCIDSTAVEGTMTMVALLRLRPS